MRATDGLHTDITEGDTIMFGLQCRIIALEPGKDNADLQLQPELTPPVITADSSAVFIPANATLQNG